MRFAPELEPLCSRLVCLRATVVQLTAIGLTSAWGSKVRSTAAVCGFEIGSAACRSEAPVFIADQNGERLVRGSFIAMQSRAGTCLESRAIACLFFVYQCLLQQPLA